MINQIIFIFLFFSSIAVFSFSIYRIYHFYLITKPIRYHNWYSRLSILLKVGFGQSKLFRLHFAGLLHALLFWGFLVISFGTLEMVVDGFTNNHQSFQGLGTIYNIINLSIQIMGGIILIVAIIFLSRRLFVNIPRFNAPELKRKGKREAILILSLIILLMITLFFISSSAFAWWLHIILIFVFLNLLPYSKHFHIITAAPNLLLADLEAPSKMKHMKNIEHEVRAMLHPEQTLEVSDIVPERFGIKDIEDLTRKHYLDALSCTQCGRCTNACPANRTGHKLSPRKIVMDVRERMNEKGPLLLKNGLAADDHKSLLGNYITEEELWACTTCGACVQECPVMINPMAIILEMRRYLVMEEGTAPAGITAVFANIENNGSPWQISSDQRTSWIK
ncbi:MAG: (Fe-S)-binding protein [Bacteroidetes bacterium]|nr:(Fe-S)-binding protein [Bacteroidota bacterium]